MLSSEQDLLTPYGQSFVKHLVSLMLCMSDMEGKVNAKTVLDMFYNTLMESSKLDLWQAVNDMYWRTQHNLFTHLHMSFEAGRRSMPLKTDEMTQTESEEKEGELWIRAFVDRILANVGEDQGKESEQWEAVPPEEEWITVKGGPKAEWITVKGGPKAEIVEPPQEVLCDPPMMEEVPRTPIKKGSNKKKKKSSPAPQKEAVLQVKEMNHKDLVSYMKKGTDEDNLILVSMELKKRETLVESMIKGSIMFIMGGVMITVPNFSIQVNKANEDEQNYIKTWDMLIQIMVSDELIPKEEMPLVHAIKGLKEMTGIADKPDVMTFIGYSLSALGCLMLPSSKEQLCTSGMVRSILIKVLTQVHSDFFWGNLMTARVDAALASGTFFDLQVLLDAQLPTTDKLLEVIQQPVVFQGHEMPLHEVIAVASAMIVLNGWADVGKVVEDTKIMVWMDHAWDVLCDIDLDSKQDIVMRTTFLDAVGRFACAMDALRRAENSRRCLQHLCPSLAPMYDWIKHGTPPSSEYVLGQDCLSLRMSTYAPLPPQDVLGYHVQYPLNIRKILGSTHVIGDMPALTLARKIEMRIHSVAMRNGDPPAKTQDPYAFTLAKAFVEGSRNFDVTQVVSPQIKTILTYLSKMFKMSGNANNEWEIQKTIRAIVFDD